jgi:hypothetical protein
MKNNGYNGYIKWKTFVQKSEKKDLYSGKTFYTRTLHAGKFTFILTGLAQENSASGTSQSGNNVRVTKF